MSRILILDDDKAVLNCFEVLLAQARRFEVEALSDSTRAFDTLASRSSSSSCSTWTCRR
jgi:PleD family two-component response regulator